MCPNVSVPLAITQPILHRSHSPFLFFRRKAKAARPSSSGSSDEDYVPSEPLTSTPLPKSTGTTITDLEIHLPSPVGRYTDEKSMQREIIVLYNGI